MMTRIRLALAALGSFSLRKPLRHPLTRIRDAAARGDADARYQLGECYLAGWHLPHQPATGVAWLRLAAAQGHARAQHSLSIVYMSGARASGEAAAWLRESCAASAGNTNANLLYPNGLDVAPDPVKALDFARAAADQGLGCAQANLGMFYLRGIGCQQDFAQAAEWCRRAAEQNESVGALGLGLIHEHGFGVERNPVEAAVWYRTGAQLGNDAAATALGLLHLDGLGVERDLVKARRLMAGPASRGDALAKKGMAELDAIRETDIAFDPGQRGATVARIASVM